MGPALLGKAAVEASPGFAMFMLDSGVMLGLWERGGVEPAATTPGGADSFVITTPCWAGL